MYVVFSRSEPWNARSEIKLSRFTMRRKKHSETRRDFPSTCLLLPASTPQKLSEKPTVLSNVFHAKAVLNLKLLQSLKKKLLS
jgi:hypothetical protein